MFAAATLAPHPRLAFGSHPARRARFHQASPGQLLASSVGFRWFARRRTRQQALPRVPAGECKIRRNSCLSGQVKAPAGPA
jgi:hypothetical protein